MRALFTALLSGLVFAIGLGISGMTQPQKVIGFLDLFGGHWDPTLALVMIGAIAVHLPAYAWLRRRASVTKPTATVVIRTVTRTSEGDPMITARAAVIEDPRAAEDDGPGTRPQRAGVDRRLVLGEAIFGIGWGLAGYCPGPAIATLVTFSPGILIFVASMMTGMWLFHLLLGGVPSAPTAAPPRSSRSGKDQPRLAATPRSVQ